eukprot:2039449-Prymnesium_polylepis.1
MRAECLSCATRKVQCMGGPPRLAIFVLAVAVLGFRLKGRTRSGGADAGHRELQQQQADSCDTRLSCDGSVYSCDWLVVQSVMRPSLLLR